MNIYFACSITGGREFEGVYQELIASLLADGHEIPTAHLAGSDVLALEAGNRQALEGLMILDTNTKQFAEAHEWALKAIAADATNADAYYTVGFLDWATTYPDYAAARLSADP